VSTPPSPAPAGDAEGHHLIAQAEVPPLDIDGVQAATVGSAMFALAAVIMALGYGRLAAAGDGWWLGVALSGLGLGLVGLAYTISRRRRRRQTTRPTIPD
jgi:hypothetical protein